MVFNIKSLRGKNQDGPQGTTNLDPNNKVRLVTPNQAKREAWVTGELKNGRPPVTLPKFSWDKKDD